MGLIDKIFTGGASGTVGIIANVIGKVVGDKDLKRKLQSKEGLAELEAGLKKHAIDTDLEKSLRDAVKEENLGQMRINEADAKSGDRVQSWWRPACGWVGAASLFWTSIGFSMATWIDHWFVNPEVVPVEPNTQFVQLVLLGMLGLRGMEKHQQARAPRS